MAAIQQAEMGRVGASVALHGRGSTVETGVPSLTPLEEFSFDVSGYIVCRGLLDETELAAAAADPAGTLSAHRGLLEYVQHLTGEAHLPGLPAPPVLSEPPALIAAAPAAG